jgi:hypothetical protein
MAAFYGYLSGNRGEVTRTGHPKSGINAHLKSWVHDVYIRLKADEEGNDILSLEVPKDMRIEINGITYVIRDDNEEIFKANGWL